MARAAQFRRVARTSGRGAAAQAVTARLRRLGDIAGWVVIGFALSVLIFNIWRAWRPMCQFIESPAFTAAPAPGGRR